MRKFVSLCLCAALFVGVLSGCAGDGATIGGLQKSTKAGATEVVEEVHKTIKDTLWSEGNIQKEVAFAGTKLLGISMGAVKRVTETTVLSKMQHPVRLSDEEGMHPLVKAIKEALEKMKQSEQALTPSGESVDIDFADSIERAKEVFTQLEIADQNSLYSPLSLEMAMGLISEGASGETRAQILKFLGTSDYSVVAKAVLGRLDDVTDDSPYGKTEMKIANSLWVSDKSKISKSFQSIVSEAYRGVATTVNFSDAELAASLVNSWCDENTNGMIPSIITPDVITPELAMILCNSVYFESPWLEPWDVVPGQFMNADGSITELEDMLHDCVEAYYETEGAVAFSKNYHTGSTFIGILPDEGKSLSDIDQNALLESKTYDYDVVVEMPKLNFGFSCDNLVPALINLGVVDVFGSNAELTSMIDSRLNLSNILQKCKIELDENGTKAAAVTIGMMDLASLPEFKETREVKLDRPFYLMILDNPSSQVLFIGSVNQI